MRRGCIAESFHGTIPTAEKSSGRTGGLWNTRFGRDFRMIEARRSMGKKKSILSRSAGLALLLLSLLQAIPGMATVMDAQDWMETTSPLEFGPRPDSLTVLPEDGREIYFRAIDAAKEEIRIEICVLEDPQILERIRTALDRGVRVRVIVDRGKYGDISEERANLQQYLTSAGGELHLSNPLFPRSFQRSFSWTRTCSSMAPHASTRRPFYSTGTLLTPAGTSRLFASSIVCSKTTGRTRLPWTRCRHPSIRHHRFPGAI